MTIFLISIGGALGAISRYIIGYGGLFSSLISIVIINAIASFSIGYLFKFQGASIWFFFGIGFCGAFSTFSTFSLDSARLLMAGSIQQFIIYFLVMNGLSIGACLIGYKLALP